MIPNLWLGTTVESQKEADIRIPILIDTPASTRFLSVEPMIGKMTLKKLHRKTILGGISYPCAKDWLFDIDWVIVGGESGAKDKVREMDPAWVQKIYNECKDARTPFFFKQWGAIKPKDKYDFETIREYPLAGVNHLSKKEK